MKHLTRLLFIVTVMLTFVLALPLVAQDEVQANKAVVTNYLDFVYNQMNLEGASTLLADTAVFHDPIWDSRDISGFVNNYRQFYQRVTELKITPYVMIAEGDVVAVPYLWEGRKYPQEPRAAYEPLSGNAVEFFRVQDGKIVEIWRQYEQHDFSILGSAEDYRSQLNMAYAAPSLVESTGIPALADALVTPSLVETTGIPSLTDMSYAPGAGLPSIAQDLGAYPIPTEPEVAYAPGAGMAQPQTTVADTDRLVVLRWIDAYNHGKLDSALMLPTFVQHTCPCDGVGTVDLKTFTDTFNQMTATGGILPITPVSHDLGFTMVSEGGLTAILFDTHIGNMDLHPEGISIFRLEEGKIAEQWVF